MEIFKLTQREKELCFLLKKGSSDTEIAGDLCISLHTVRDHVKNIYKKTNVSSRAKLVAMLNQTTTSPKEDPDSK